MRKLSRLTALVGVAGLTTAGLLALAGPASADIEAPAVTVTHPGALHFSTTSGDGNDDPTWSTTAGCPASDTIANLYMQTPLGQQKITTNLGNAGTGINNPSGFDTGTLTGAAAAAASINNTMSGEATGTGGSVPGTFQFYLGCSVGASAPDNLVADAYITFANDGSWTYSATAPQGAPAATISITSPTSGTTVAFGDSVDVKASVDATATGTVQFEDTAVSPAANIGSAVPVTAGVADSGPVTNLTAGVHNIVAVYQPGATDTVSAATSPAITLIVAGSNSETIDFNVVADEGTFSYEIPTNPVVHLTGQTHSGTYGSGTYQFTGALNSVLVHDNRQQTQPGWNVSGVMSDFSGNPTSGPHANTTVTVSGNDLGWAPADSTDSTTSPAGLPGATISGSPSSPSGLVGTITGAANGYGGTLAGGKTLASAGAGTGLGTNTLTAPLNLVVPDSTAPGTYTATMTFTAFDAFQ